MIKNGKYSTGWISKNVGISRETIRQLIREKYFSDETDPIEIDPNNNKYQFFSCDQIERMWVIKLFIELGFTHKELKDWFSNPDREFTKIMQDKIDDLEEKKTKYTNLLEHAKAIKLTGLIPALPKKIGSIKFNDFLKISVDKWSEYVDRGSNYSEEIVTEVVDSMMGKPSEDVLDAYRQNSHYITLMKLINEDPTSEIVQSVVQSLYELVAEKVMRKLGEQVTKRWFVDHQLIWFTGSDISLSNKMMYGEDGCDFIVRAFDYFADSNTNA